MSCVFLGFRCVRRCDFCPAVNHRVSVVGDAPFNSGVCMCVHEMKKVDNMEVGLCCEVGRRYAMWANICVKLKLWNVSGMKGWV